MHKILTCCLIGLLAFGLGMNEAAAKRFGGGRSFGVQRAKSNFFKPFSHKLIFKFLWSCDDHVIVVIVEKKDKWVLKATKVTSNPK